MSNIKKPVLVVDDMASKRKFIIQQLRKQGHNIFIEVANIKDAFKELKQSADIGLIVTGWNFPNYFAMELMSAIKHLNHHNRKMTVETDTFCVDSHSTHGDGLDIIDSVKEAKKNSSLVVLNHRDPKVCQYIKIIPELQFDLQKTIDHSC